MRISYALTLVMVLAMILLPGCTLYTIKPPSDMTVEQAKGIIRSYIKSDMKERIYQMPEVIVEDNYFSDLKERELSFENRIVKYRDIGEIKIQTEVGPYLTYAVFTPYVLTVEESNKIIATDRLLSPLWTRVIPFWLLGPQFWYKSDTEKYYEALCFMRNYVKSPEHRKGLTDRPRKPSLIEPYKKVKEPELEDLFTPTEIKLECELTGTTQGVAGQPSTFTCLIRNIGKNSADIYRLQIALPSGLNFIDDKLTIQNLVFQQLGPGEEKEYIFTVKAEDPGEYPIKTQVFLDQTKLDEAQINFSIASQSNLKLSFVAPSKVYKQNELEYLLTVESSGGALASNASLKLQLDPEKLSYISATPEGVYNDQQKILTWEIGDLPVGESRSFQVTCNTNEEGIIVSRALAKLGEEVLDKKRLATEIYSSAGLQIFHSDTNDPVAVGSDTSYIIRIGNRGSKDANNISVFDRLPDQVEFVSASVTGVGFTINHNVKGQGVTFDNIPKLSPGEELSIEVKVKVIKKGDLLNTLKIKSDDFNKILTSQEPTTAIGDEEEETTSETTSSETTSETTSSETTVSETTTETSTVNIEETLEQSLEESLLEEALSESEEESFSEEETETTEESSSTETEESFSEEETETTESTESFEITEPSSDNTEKPSEEDSSTEEEMFGEFDIDEAILED